MKTDGNKVLTAIIDNPKPGYKETLVFNYPNGTVRVNIPDIDAEENERRMQLVKKAAEKLYKSMLIQELEAEKRATARKTKQLSVEA